MSEYYGIAPSSDFFAHYGIRGMKWGIRKAIQRKGLVPKSSAFKNAENKLNAKIGIAEKIRAYNSNDKVKENRKINRKLFKGEMVAGLLGGDLGQLAYDAAHLKDRKKYYSNLRSIHSGNNRPVQPASKSQQKPTQKASTSRKQLEREFREASAARQEALNRRNKSFIGSMGYGKKQAAYKQADEAARRAADRFYGSMNAKQRKRYHDRRLG